MLVARGGGGRTARFGGFERLLGQAEFGGSESARVVGILSRPGGFAAVAKRRALVADLVQIGLGAIALGGCRDQRRLGNPALGAHRGFAGEQAGQRSLGSARIGFNSGQLRSDSYRL